MKEIKAIDEVEQLIRNTTKAIGTLADMKKHFTTFTCMKFPQHSKGTDPTTKSSGLSVATYNTIANTKYYRFN